MAIDDKWERHNYFQKHGRYPETSKQQKAREAKERDLAENGPSEEAHGVVSSAQQDRAQSKPANDPIARAVEKWHRENPGFR